MRRWMTWTMSTRSDPLKLPEANCGSKLFLEQNPHESVLAVTRDVSTADSRFIPPRFESPLQNSIKVVQKLVMLFDATYTCRTPMSTEVETD